MRVVMSNQNDWRLEILELNKSQEDGRPIKPLNARHIPYFVIIREDLYKRGISTPILKCLSKDEAWYVMDELHNDVCSMHIERDGWAL